MIFIKHPSKFSSLLSQYLNSFRQNYLMQVTRFACGGHSIGIGTSHSLFDGPATYDFLSAWACNSAIRKRKGVTVSDHQPVHERGIMVLDNISHVHNAGTVKSPMAAARAAAIDHLHQLIKNALINRQNWEVGGLNFSEMGSSNYVLKTFHLSGTIVESLKRKVLGERRVYFSCSSFELVAAHLWKVSFF